MKNYYFKIVLRVSLLFACLGSMSAGLQAQSKWNTLYTETLQDVLGLSVIPDITGIFEYKDNLYVSAYNIYYPHDQYNEKGKIFKLKKTSEGWEADGSFVIADLNTTWNFVDFTIAGDYLYGVTRSRYIYKIKLADWTLDSTLETSYYSCIAIEYDPQQNAFWLAENNNNRRVALVDMEGKTILDQQPLVASGAGSNSITGLAYDNYTNGGPYLISACGNAAISNTAVLGRWKLDTGEFAVIQDVSEITGSDQTGYYMGGICMYPDFSSGKIVLAGISKKFALLFGYDYMNYADGPDAPAKITDFKIEPGTSGALKATLYWRNPDLKVNGETLTDLTAIQIYRGDDLVHTVNSPVIGAEATWTDESATEGIIKYRLIPVNGSGKGPSTISESFIGKDTPAAVTGFTLSKEGDHAKLTWTPPAKGNHNGWIDVNNTFYKVTRYPDEVVLTTNATGNSFTDQTITELKNYHYQITSCNDIGEGGNAVSNNLVLGPYISVPWKEDFSDSKQFSIWTVIDANEDNNTWQWQTDGSVAYFYHSTNAGDDWMISPEIRLEAGKIYLLKWKDKGRSPTYQEKYEVKMGNNATPAAQSTLLIEESAKSTGYVEKKVLVKDITTTGNYHFSWHSVTDPNTSGLYIDDIAIETTAAVDMEVVALKGQNGLTVGKETTHTVTVKNNGSDEASGFKVSIYDAENNKLGETTYNDHLTFNQTADITIVWTPKTDGEYKIKAVVDIENDENDQNNETYMAVKVWPEGVEEIKVGNLEEIVNNLPFYFTFSHSVSQALYYPDEIKQSGRIDHLYIYSQFGSEYKNRNIQLYMSLTDKQEFENRQWITEGTLVYDGNIDFSNGKDTIQIKLDRPFYYSKDKNLMVMYVAPKTEQTNSTGNFYVSTSEREKRILNSYNIGMNPIFDVLPDGKLHFSDPGINAVNNSYIINATFIVDTEVGTVKGIVTDGIAPLKDVKISVEGTKIHAFTNSTGEYELSGVPVGSQTITATKNGYTQATISLQVTKDGVYTENFEINNISHKLISGTVKNISGETLERASITFCSGEHVFKGVTNEEGKFEIPVYGAREYLLKVTAAGYIILDTELIVGESDLTMEDITLTACTSNSAGEINYNLHTTDWYDITLSWKAPETMPDGELKGYNIYANGLLLNHTEPVKDMTYTFTAPEPGTYVMEVAAVWDSGCESQRISASVVMEIWECEVPVTVFPYLEGFEENKLPDCWSQEFIAGEMSWSTEVRYYVPEGHSGKYRIQYSNNMARTSTKLITPMLDISELSAPSLHFWHQQPVIGSNCDILKVYIKDSHDAEWLLLEEYDIPTTDWEETVLDLPNPSDTYWIAFEGNIEYGGGIFLDDIRVLDDVCEEVTKLTVTQTGETTTTLTWEAPANSTRIKGYRVERDKEIVGVDIPQTTFNDKNIILGEHTYKVVTLYDKPYCIESAPAEATLTLVEMCDTVGSVTVRMPQRDKVVISWEPSYAIGVDSYTVLKNNSELITTKETSYIDNDVTEGYLEYGVRVNYKDKKICEVSEAVYEEILVKCTPVNDFNIELGNGRVAWLTWSIEFDDVAAFQIIRNGDVIATTRRMSYSDRTIEPGNIYTYSVIPLYDNGCEGEAVSERIIVDCFAPKNIEVTLTETGETCSAEITWNTDETRAEGDYMIYENGSFITHPKGGADGMDASVWDSKLGKSGIPLLYSGYEYLTATDDFELTEETHISNIDFYVYAESVTTTTSYVIAAMVIIHDGNPREGGRVIWGNLFDNVLEVTGFIDAYRTSPGNLTETSRPIMGVRTSINKVLPAGKYWVEMYAGGPMPPGVTGYYAVPFYEGNALYNYNGTWEELKSETGDVGIGLPFHIYGQHVRKPVNIYRDDVLIASNVTDNSYIDENVPKGKHKWSITYTCDNGVESGEVFVEKGCQIPDALDDISIDNIKVYPNPVKDKVTIEKKDMINSIQIVDISGRVLKNIDGIQQQIFEIDLSALDAGTYILKVDSREIKLIKK